MRRAVDICAECGITPPFKVGDVVVHPDGYNVKIVGGQFWGEHGLSNFWYWKRVLANGVLSKRIAHGYGWRIT